MFDGFADERVDVGEVDLRVRHAGAGLRCYWCMGILGPARRGTVSRRFWSRRVSTSSAPTCGGTDVRARQACWPTTRSSRSGQSRLTW